MELWEKLPSYTYATIKYELSKIHLLRNQNVSLVVVSVLLSLFAVPIIFLALFLISCYRKLVDVILAQQLKQRYRGLVVGVDAICCNQDVCTPSFFLLIDYAKSHEELRQDFITLLRQCRYVRHEKLFYSWNTFMGYHYYYKNVLRIEDYVTLAEEIGNVDVIKTKKDFAETVMQYDTAKLPDNDRALFQVIVYPQIVEMPNVEGTKLVCFKMHHALADGKAILGWMMADLADKEDNQTSNGTQNGTSTNGTNGTNKLDGLKPLSKSIMDDCLKSAKKTLFDDKIKIMPCDWVDDNILLGRNLLDEKFICWFSDFTSEYIDKIKAIRKSRDAVSFLDVINTCVSSSLHEYYEKHTSKVPTVISGGVVLSPGNYNFRYGDPADFSFSNEFSVGGLRFPIAIDKHSRKSKEEMLAKLQFCQKEYQAVKQSIDVKYFYWLSSVFSVLPYYIPRFMAYNFLKITIGVSSLPGSDKLMSLFGGNLVKDVILMAPNSPGTALHFVNCSYGNRFKISLTIDKSVVEKFEDAQEIVDGIIRNIDMLYEIVNHE